MNLGIILPVQWFISTPVYFCLPHSEFINMSRLYRAFRTSIISLQLTETSILMISKHCKALISEASLNSNLKIFSLNSSVLVLTFKKMSRTAI